MLIGAHVVLYSTDASADAAVLDAWLPGSTVDAGGEWLIMALPPAEAACHPVDGPPSHELFLMTDDLQTEVRTLAELGVTCSAVETPQWGSPVRVLLPSGAQLGLYQPRHATTVR